MSEFNYSKLLGRIREKGYTQAELAKAIGIGETSLNFKLNNKSLFRQDEIVSIANQLDISAADYEAYFFAH